MIKWLMRRLFNKVLISEVSHVRWNDDWWEVLEIVTYGSSYQFRSAYIIRYKREIFEIWCDDATGERMHTRWVDADSLAGILSFVTFDEKHLQAWKARQRG